MHRTVLRPVHHEDAANDEADDQEGDIDCGPIRGDCAVVVHDRAFRVVGAECDDIFAQLVFGYKATVIAALFVDAYALKAKV